MSEENEDTPIVKSAEGDLPPIQEEPETPIQEETQDIDNEEVKQEEDLPASKGSETGEGETVVQEGDVDKGAGDSPEAKGSNDVVENVEKMEGDDKEETDQTSEKQEKEGTASAENVPESQADTEAAPAQDSESKIGSQLEGSQDDYIKSPMTADSDTLSKTDSTINDLVQGEQETHPLDELSDQQVIDLVQELETENRHLYLENILFETFLNENDPSLMDGLDEIMNLLLGKKQSLESGGVPSRGSMVTTDKNRYRLDSYTSITSIAEGKGPKINLSQKTDMVMKAMEDNQSRLEAFMKKCHVIKRNLKAELEEFSIREAEIKEATDIFEYNVVVHGLDKLTQRIPAEKFIRYMEEWLKSAQLQIEKLRLRIATLKVQYKKVSQQLIQRQELGENVHAVDFDQLEIENKHFIEKIEQKNLHLIELKKMNGGANLVLSIHKKFLQRQQDDYNKLQSEISDKEKQIEETEKEVQVGEDELDAEIEKYENCKILKSKYTVPDVMEYVRLKAKLHELRKNIKIWARRRKIQDIAINTCLREMKNLTGRSEIDPAWFEDADDMGEGSLLDEIP